MTRDPLEPFKFRRPWYLLVLVGAVALLLSAAAGLATLHAMSDGAADADQVERLHVERIGLAVDDFLGDAVQLADAAAGTACASRGDRALTERLVRGLSLSRVNLGVYGMGCWFAPWAYDRRTRLFGPYFASRWTPAHRVYTNVAENYDYPHLAWYAYAVENAGRLSVFGPYRDQGVQFISAVRAFYRDGKLAGVVSVDTMLADFNGMVRAQAAPTDEVIVLDARREPALTIGRAPSDLSRAVRMDRPIRFTHATLEIIEDRTAAFAANRRAAAFGFSSIALIWLAAVLLAGALLRWWQARDRETKLELDRVRLENEIATRHEVEQELRRAAYQDMLTGLPNRAFVSSSLAEYFESRPSDYQVFVFFIDLDRFNLINDSLGHGTGDDFLRAIAERLRTSLRGQTVARFGGDEFIVVLRSQESNPNAVARLVHAVFDEPVVVRERPFYAQVSIGIVKVDESYERAEDVLRDAEIAMYAAKERGGGVFTVFDTPMRRSAAMYAALDHDLRHAILANQFVAYYQPIVDIRTRNIASFEALVRWVRPNVGIVEPVDFIPYAEAHGMVAEIDARLLTRVCEEMKANDVFANLSVSVNCSMSQLTRLNLVDLTLDLLRTNSLPPSRLKLEITETSIMRNADVVLRSLERFKSVGVETVVDDFGSGYSSLSYLQRLPISGLKIDRVFVTPLGRDGHAEAIVRSIVALARTLGLYTVAEGVETEEQLRVLERLGVEFVQGFFFSPPRPADALAQLTAQFRRLTA
ncbi:MAG: EAL domain-containing protein [Candidatus Eremiobacteraeota bacterium]|nr:EAL domain-containing protein [Candidatus Eremiobacteraeota bacterium]